MTKPISLLLALLACVATHAAEPSISLPADLARVLRDYEAAWSAMDATALSHLFTEDGLVLSDGHEPVRGRTAIAAFYRGKGGPLSLRAFSFGADTQVGYIVGGFTSIPGQPDIGKFTLTLRKDPDGRWLIVSDMDNSNR